MSSWKRWGVFAVLITAGTCIWGCEQTELTVAGASLASLPSLEADATSSQELEAERLSAEHLLRLHRTVLQSQLKQAESDDSPQLRASIVRTREQIALAERRIDNAQHELVRAKIAYR
jgi:hypothetical protein